MFLDCIVGAPGGFVYGLCARIPAWSIWDGVEHARRNSIAARFSCPTGAGAMTFAFHHDSRTKGVEGYFERLPERLVLEGYRHWLAGFETGSVTPWEMAWTLYANTLGPADGRRALSELEFFVRTLRHCPACPLRAFPFGARYVCSAECLVLGLVAGIQHGDEPATKACLDALGCPAHCSEIAAAAGSFALTLKTLDRRLLPIPMTAIQDILQCGGHASDIHARDPRGSIH
jgi:hypothetical protein